MMRMASDIYWVFWREMKRFFLQRARIVTAVVQPTVWLVLVGSNLSGLTRTTASAEVLGTDNYLAFMTPGVMVMTALFGGVFGGTTVLWDRRLGYLNKMLAAPIPRAAIPLGKLTSLMVQSWFQVIAILVVSYLLGVRVAGGIPSLLFIILLTGIFEVVMGGLSLSLAANIKSIEALFAIMNFFTLPLIFTSNAIFPVTTMPLWLQSIAMVNPLTYAVTPIRVLVLQGWVWPAIWPGVVALLLMAAASVLLAISQFRRAVV